MIKLLEIMFQNCIVGIFPHYQPPTTNTPHYHRTLPLVFSITPAENTRMSGQGKRKFNTMACQHSVSKYYCYQLLPMVYRLNKSYTKKITIGLENKKIGG